MNRTTNSILGCRQPDTNVEMDKIPDMIIFYRSLIALMRQMSSDLTSAYRW